MLGPVDGSGVMALRAQILRESQSLRPPATTAPAPADAAQAGGFGAALAQAVGKVNALQADSSAQSAAFERGETHDIAAVMLSRQKASIAFEATLQVRNRLLSAYRDVMNMPV